MPDVDLPEPVESRFITSEDWRIVAASVIGPSHVQSGGRREDAFAVSVLCGSALAVLCDGAGTAVRSAEGARRFAASVLCELEAHATDLDGLTAERFRDAVIAGVEACRSLLRAEAGTLDSFHATLVALAATEVATFVAHVGDGCAGIAPTADWTQAVLSSPENGEFSNETFFVTEDGWQSRLRCLAFEPLRPAGVAVAMTDGAMPFVIGADGAGLEPGFMGPVSRYLRLAEADAAAALAATLQTEEARRISGDDKTLIWIGRA